MHSFDPYAQPIQGTHSIEASAGTGKTYSITILWLRLLLEEDLSIEQILVSTFTQAATAELKERLLTSLRSALNVAKQLEAGEAPADCPERPVLLSLVRSHPSAATPLIRKLSKAISAFDLAPISTIHGFCQSLITRHALELGCDANLTVTPDCEDLVQQIADDEIMCMSEDPNIDPTALRGIAHKVALQLETPRIAADAGTTEKLAELKAAILLRKDDTLAGVKNAASKKAVARKIEALETENIWEKIEGTQADAAGPEFLNLWKQFEQLQVETERLAFANMADAVSKKLPERKRSAGLRTFDDVLRTIQTALQTQGPNGRLAGVVRKRLRAAIIDECQDSDSTQIYIFDRLFRNPHTVSFIVIGDPKQSIYRFRGADLASYKQLAAEAGVTQAPVMTVNFRSDPPLISALNGLYGEQFPFPDALSPGRETLYVPVSTKAKQAGIHDPAGLEALVFLWSNATRRESAKTQIAAQVATECARLLRQKVQINDRHTGNLRPITPGDIAVLARGHRDLGLIRRALTSQGIVSQSGGKSLGSIFGSDEATDVLAWLCLLEALHSRRNVLSHLLTFLGTPLGGFSPGAILEVRDDSALQTRLTAHFQNAASEFQRSGPLPLLLQHLSQAPIIEANFPFADAERRYTNWQHVAALLQHEHGRGRRGTETLILWLARQIASKPETAGDPDSAESAMMKLETDSEAVQLVTIHNSKGLEYPVTFCPFLWDVLGLATRKESPTALLREPSRWLLDIGSSQFNRNQQTQLEQEDEEEHRKLYVALTRARHRLYLGVAAIPSSGTRFDNSAQKSALAHLLRFNARPLPEWRDALSEIPHSQTLESAPPTTGLPAPAPLAQPSGLTAPATPEHYRFPFHRTHSFSSLSKSDDDHFSPTDRDEDQPVVSAPTEASLDLLQPLGDAGAILGDSLHTVLEEYLGNRRDLPTAIGAREPKEQWEQAISTILATDLRLPGPTQTTLDSIRAGCVTEMQFHLPATQVSSGELSRVLLQDPSLKTSDDRQDWARSIQDWNFSQFGGFLQGYIDLIFEQDGRWYVADYKSNKLPGYTPADLEHAMLHKNYMLQARLYALALHRHLSVQLPNYTYAENFGGVVYLFVRGFPNAGIWTDRPSLSSLEQLGSLFTASR